MSKARLDCADDRRLVALARSGCSEAFTELDSRYRPLVRKYCRRLVGEGDADDVTQQTLANAFDALKGTDKELDVRPWIYRIAHNAAIDALRSAPPPHQEIPDNFDGVIQPPKKVAQKERLFELVGKIGDLPHRQRSALVMCELEGRSHEEAASILKTCRITVKHLVYHARESLREKMSALLPISWIARHTQLAGAPASSGGDIAATIKVFSVAVLAVGSITAASEISASRDGPAERTAAGAEQLDRAGMAALPKDAHVASHSRLASRGEGQSRNRSGWQQRQAATVRSDRPGDSPSSGNGADRRLSDGAGTGSERVGEGSNRQPVGKSATRDGAVGPGSDGGGGGGGSGDGGSGGGEDDDGDRDGPGYDDDDDDDDNDADDDDDDADDDDDDADDDADDADDDDD